jgi:hypothetical protein
MINWPEINFDRTKRGYPKIKAATHNRPGVHR